MDDPDLDSKAIRAIDELVDTLTRAPEEWGRIVEAHRSVLLHHETLGPLQHLVQTRPWDGSDSYAATMVVLNFLKMARDRGIAKAVEAERQRRSLIAEAIVAFVNAPAIAAEAVLRQYRQILLTPEAVLRTRLYVRGLVEQEGSSDPSAGDRRRVRDLKLQLLEEVRAFGFDGALQRYRASVGADIAGAIREHMEEVERAGGSAAPLPWGATAETQSAPYIQAIPPYTAARPAAPASTAKGTKRPFSVLLIVALVLAGAGGGAFLYERYQRGSGSGIGTTLHGHLTEFALPAPSDPGYIATGPDGALWFTENSDKIGRITTSGAIAEFALPPSSVQHFFFSGLTAGPDGAVWFLELPPKIGRITPDGSVAEFTLPPGTSEGDELDGIAAGPDGALWFTDSREPRNAIGRISTAGVITEFALDAGSAAYDITAGPDGSLWFTGPKSQKIGRITTSGAVTEFAFPESVVGPYRITAGPDGALWFTEGGFNFDSSGGSVFPGSVKVGRITTSGVITEFPLPTAKGVPLFITAGPDGALWFPESYPVTVGNGTYFYSNTLGRITVAGDYSETTVPTANGASDAIADIVTGPDGALWFTEELGNKIGRLT